AKKAAESDLSLQDILNTEFTTVPENTYLTEIFDVVSDANIPIAVVDEKQRMKGIVVRGALIGALAGNNDYINVEGTDEQTQDPSAQEVK
ncbi:CBS domain-containing protein, partial [Bacillus halotolerans]|uniref:CBS domain-containing protein n=2 Tax=Bacillaceae TaxID=186817 RepID=UPI002280B688